MAVLDTNAVLRFLLYDDAKKAEYVRDAMNQESCLLPVEALAEAVYVMAKTYKLERELIQKTLLDFLRNENVETPSQAVVETALRYFGETKLDFVDCLMVGYAIIEGHRIVTFDRELEKYCKRNAD
jgi:predicted nucleic-acid-binding protein